MCGYRLGVISISNTHTNLVLTLSSPPPPPLSSAPRYTSHGNKLVASFVLVFYFLYLSVTRRALDVFNCNPVDPDDGYLYTEFTSIDCEAGLCRCDDPDELQAQLVPYAVLCIVFYSIGFPLYVVWVTWYYRIQIKLDQLLRAHDMGQDRANR